MLNRLGITVLSLVLALVAPSSTQATSAASEEATLFRANFGLEVSSSHIAMVAKQSAEDREVDNRYGVPLLPHEAAELDRRIGISESLGPIRDLLAKDESSYGGHYIDQPNGGTVVVQLVGSRGPSEADLSTSSQKGPLFG